jgi:hypothetical protein
LLLHFNVLGGCPRLLYRCKVPGDSPSVRWCVKGEQCLLGELWQNCEKVGINAETVGISG